jgi:hypothetical protein
MDDATRAQVGAADPARSAWVSANAGSGKTRVLTDRVARLLLADAPPEKILCLTYTKAAAAEMQTRLFALLGRWAMMDDDALLAELQSRSETPLALEDGALDRARRLFASALETPGGLKIQTIHAFCDALLRRFPLEAGVSPRFDVLDDRQRAAMLTALRDRMAEDAARGVDLAFDGAADRVGEGKMAELTDQILDRRDLFGAGGGVRPRSVRQRGSAAGRGGGDAGRWRHGRAGGGVRACGQARQRQDPRHRPHPRCAGRVPRRRGGGDRARHLAQGERRSVCARLAVGQDAGRPRRGAVRSLF